MPPFVSRRAFLAAAGSAAMAPGLRAAQPRATPAPTPRGADVVIVGGDPAAFSAAWRLTQTPGLRVVLVDDQPAWQAPGPPPPSTVAAQAPFVRGHQVCFDSWRDLGNPGWGYLDVLPSFKRLERYEAGETEYRGGSGPLAVAHCWDPHLLHRGFLLAAVSGGYQQDSRHDFNGPRSQGYAGYYQKAQRDDRPLSLAQAFLEPALGAGLTVLRGVSVQRLVFERGRAVGVELRRGTAREEVRATQGVLLAAGAERAAQLLLLSGIGPAAHLRTLDVPVVADRPGVGGNHQRHLRLALRFEALDAARALPDSSVTAGMFTVSLAASPPDLQMDLVDPRAAGAPLVGLDVTLVQPASRGQVRLRTLDADTAPLVDARTLSAAGDLTALVQGVRLGRFVVSGPQLDRFRGDEVGATRAAQSQQELEALVRAGARPIGDSAGTCAMGRADDAAAVVDASLAVHGVSGLHVTGAAVMPVVVNAPPEAACLMMGDRAAEVVRRGGRA